MNPVVGSSYSLSPILICRFILDLQCTAYGGSKAYDSENLNEMPSLVFALPQSRMFVGSLATHMGAWPTDPSEDESQGDTKNSEWPILTSMHELNRNRSRCAFRSRMLWSQCSDFSVEVTISS